MKKTICITALFFTLVCSATFAKKKNNVEQEQPPVETPAPELADMAETGDPELFPGETDFNRSLISNIDSLSFIAVDELSAIDWSLNSLYSYHLTNNSPDCFSDSTKITCTPAEYMKRLSALPYLIEMPYNEIVQTYIDFYVHKRPNQVSRLLGLSTYYFPIFEEALERHGMPLELKYLPVIESALNPVALSRVGASGLWQFMLATGKAYGLQVNSLVDERRDPIKATEAGVKYLKDLYNIYNDWHLAIAAYNCGPGNVNKAIKRAGGKRDYWAIYYFLPRETRGYVPAFIAANYAMNYHQEHGICPVNIVDFPMLSDTIQVHEKVHLQQVADVLSIPIEELRILNPQYRKDIVLGTAELPQTLCLPLNQTTAFIDRKDSIMAYKADELLTNRVEVKVGGEDAEPGEKIYYRVKSGDYLGRIASRYNVPVASIKKWNNLSSNFLRVGQRLVIYPSGKAPATKSSSSSTVTASSTTKSSNTNYATASTYTVKQGDNLWLIARKFPGISSEDIAKANNLTNNTIKAGQVLKIPKK